MKKHLYQLILNRGGKAARPVSASYGRNRSPEIHIRSDGIMISVVSTGEKDPREILNGQDGLFADLVRKALTLFAIRYNRFLDVKSAKVLADGTEQAAYSLKDSGQPLIYSLSDGELRLGFHSRWNTPGVSAVIAGTSKSSADSRFSALHALLIAKSDRFEIERFTYYWMAMNGLYSYVAAAGEKLAKELEKKRSIDKENEKLRFFAKCYGEEYLEINGNKKERKLQENRLVWQITPVIRSIPEGEIDAFCDACAASDDSNIHVRRITAATRNLNRLYGYETQYPVFSLMLLWYPYRLRCTSFHGESALPTFCYSDDNRIRELRVINRLLDRFLTDQLLAWLDPAVEAREQRREMLAMIIHEERQKK